MWPTKNPLNLCGTLTPALNQEYSVPMEKPGTVGVLSRHCNITCAHYILEHSRMYRRWTFWRAKGTSGIADSPHPILLWCCSPSPSPSLLSFPCLVNNCPCSARGAHTTVKQAQSLSNSISFVAASQSIWWKWRSPSAPCLPPMRLARPPHLLLSSPAPPPCRYAIPALNLFVVYPLCFLFPPSVMWGARIWTISGPRRFGCCCSCGCFVACIVELLTWFENVLSLPMFFCFK